MMVLAARRPVRKGACIAVMIGVALASCVAPSMARSAVGQESLLPFARLYQSLGVKPGVYYLVSPELVTRGNRGPADFDIYRDVKQLRFGKSYVIVHGTQETLSRREKLARKNMAIIRSHLAVAPPTMPKGTTLEPMGYSDIDELVWGASYLCHIDFVDEPHSRLILPIIGKRLSYMQYCVGLGIGAALAGYRIRVINQRLTFQRVIDVVQGGAVAKGLGSASTSKRP
jgi:hypothetical protein